MLWGCDGTVAEPMHTWPAAAECNGARLILSRNWPLAQHHALGAARAGDEGAHRAAATADKPHRSLPHSLLLLLPFDWNFPLREKSLVFPFSSLWAQRQWEKKSWNLGSSIWAMPSSSLSGNFRRSRTTKDLVVDAVQQAAHGEGTSGSRKLPPSTAARHVPKP